MLIPSEEIAALKEQLEKFVSSEVMLNKLLADNAALKAEVERLRGALNEIIVVCGSSYIPIGSPSPAAREGFIRGASTLQVAIQPIAQAALSQPESQPDKDSGLILPADHPWLSTGSKCCFNKPDKEPQ